MSNQAKTLMEAFGRAANGFQQEDVIDAAANLIVNTLRQKHLRLAAAQEELDGLHQLLSGVLRQQHYTIDGVRKNAVILNPAMFPELAAMNGVKK